MESIEMFQNLKIEKLAYREAPVCLAIHFNELWKCSKQKNSFQINKSYVHTKESYSAMCIFIYSSSVSNANVL